MTTNPFDRDFFSVFSVLCRHKGELYFAELAPATKTLAAVVDDIATGQIEHVLMVFRWKPAEYTCEDISYGSPVPSSPNTSTMMASLPIMRLRRFLKNIWAALR